MNTKLRVSWLVLGCLCLPILLWAQSPESRGAVSIRELSIPRKAHQAFEQGVQLLGKKDAAGSLPHFQRAMAEFPSYYEALYEMGVANLKLRRIADAEQAFRRSVALSSGQFAPPLLGLGGVLGLQEKFAEAEEVTRKGLDLDMASWSGHYYLGWALLGLNRLEEAEKSVREALRLKTDFPEALRLLIDIHSREKNYSALLKDLDEYLKLDPDSPVGLRAKALRESAQRMLAESQSSASLTQPLP
jgi:tetratricopeptide (TPR) repeat protein